MNTIEKLIIVVLSEINECLRKFREHPLIPVLSSAAKLAYVIILLLPVKRFILGDLDKLQERDRPA
jgi:hypothetical protein